jgi:hypothetical protein
VTSPVYLRGRDLLEANVGDELVALDPESGNCIGFNSVAASVWRNLDRPKAFDELRDALVAEYEVTSAQCTAELSTLLADLVERKILILSEGQDD